MSDDELSHLRGVNARLFADVRELQEQLDQAAVREAGLSLAATQYSESRDHWKATAERYKAAIEQALTDLHDGRPYGGAEATLRAALP